MRTTEVITKISKWFIGISCLTLITTLGFAENKILTVQPTEKIILQKDKKVDARIAIIVEDGFHVQANPAADKYLIPTTLTLEGRDGMTFGKASYPKGKKLRLKGAKKDILVFDGKFLIKIPVTLTSSVTKGDMELKGKLRYQACNDTNCLFPKTVPFVLHAVVGNADSKK